jgi:hypothetical protein
VSITESFFMAKVSTNYSQENYFSVVAQGAMNLLRRLLKVAPQLGPLLSSSEDPGIQCSMVLA